jgi:hypothetical protein
MKDLSQALREISDLFESMGVPYAVMGGVAVRVYAIPRPTYDIDFTVSLEGRELSDFFQRAMSAGYSVPEPYLEGWVDRVAGMPLVKLRLYLADHGVDVDIFLAESAFQHSLLLRRRCEDYQGRPIWFVSPEDLVLLKLVAGRTRDLLDIQDVLFTQGRLDETYMRRWAADLGVSEALEQVLTRH